MMQAMSPLPPLTDVLSRLDQWYATHLPAVWTTLRPGVTEADLDAFETRTALQLPEAFRALYRWHDGQDWSVGGVLGLAFMPLAEVEFTSMMWQDIAEGDGADINIDIYVVSHPTGAIREQYASPSVVPLLSDARSNAVALDLAPDLCGQLGAGHHHRPRPDPPVRARAGPGNLPARVPHPAGGGPSDRAGPLRLRG